MVCPMSALPTALQAALPAALTRSPNPNPNPTQPPPRPDSAMTLLPLPVASLRLTEAEAAPAFPAATQLHSPSSPPRHVPLADAPRLALSVQMVRWGRPSSLGIAPGYRVLFKPSYPAVH